jgi:hypothetical protein
VFLRRTQRFLSRREMKPIQIYSADSLLFIADKVCVKKSKDA